MSNILVLGDGLLGSELVAQTGWDYISRKKDGFDITDESTFHLLTEIHHGVAQSCKYHTIVNCIANTDTYSNDRQLHWDVNYKGVAKLVEFCNNWGIKLVHISTDYVYANSSSPPTELDIPVHQETYYAYTKLLADGFIELKANKYLIIRTTHKPTPFPYEGAWINHSGNFDYVDVVSNICTQLIKKNAEGIFNVGTEFKTMYHLARQTNSDVKPIINANGRIPLNVGMNITKLNKFLNED
jgi:dTDP-4-dehydrorhamnose reductase